MRRQDLSNRAASTSMPTWRSKKRQSTETEKRSPQFWTRRSGISSSVMSGVRRINLNAARAIEVSEIEQRLQALESTVLKGK